MTSMIPDMGPIFQNGFLASNVSRLIAVYHNDTSYQLSPGNKSLIKKASSFVDDILNSQLLVSGRRGKKIPSLYGLMAFKNAVMSIPHFHSDAANSSQRRTALFERIRNVLEDMIAKPKNEVETDGLQIAQKFFLVLSDIYLNEAERKIRLETYSRPK